MLDAIGGLPGPLSTFIYFLISLFPLVLVHELGHFVLAKLNGVRVEEFGIGFPPRMVRLFKIAETEYTINWLPLGGFVRLLGEDDPDVPGSFASAPKRVRAAVLLAGPVFNFILAAMIFAAVAMAGLAREPVPAIKGVTVAHVVPGQPGAVAGIRDWDIIVALDGKPLSDLVTAKTESGMDPLMQGLIDKTDASADKPMTVTLLRGAQRVPGDWQNLPATTEPEEIPGMPGARRVTTGAGKLEVGDVIAMPDASGLASGTDEVAGAMSPVVLRGLTVEEVQVTPVRTGTDQKGRMGIEISSPILPAKVSLLEAPLYGLQTTGAMIVAMVDGLAKMFTGRMAVNVAGPVRIAEISKDAGQRGASVLLTFMALLSINLGVINLLPIPAFDGGRLLFIAVEALRGRRIEPNREAVVNMIGLVLVLGLMLVITVVEVLGLGAAR